MNIDENRVYKDVEKLSFPRLVGSEGEAKAREFIIEELQKIGFKEIKREKFLTSTFIWNLIRYAFVIIGIIIILTGYFLAILPLISIILAGLIIFFVFKLLGTAGSNKIRLYRNAKKNIETENIICEIPHSGAKNTFIFIGHYDTKSQSFPTAVRMLIIMIPVFGTLFLMLAIIVLGILKLTLGLSFSIVEMIIFYLTVIFSLIGIVNFFNKTENKSIGSLDNATGVAILLELARFFKNYNDIKSNLIFLFTSSEELNLGGAIDYFNKHQKELSKENTYIINYDLAGGHNEIRILTAHGIPKKSIKNELTDLFLKIGKEQGLDVREYYIPTGAWVDNLVFANNGFKTIWVGSGGVMKYVHSKKDNMEIVSKTGLKNVLELTLKLIKELESKT